MTRPRTELRARAEADLRARYSEVIGVGFGLKETGGETTNRAALRIYVRKKKPRSELSEAELLPSEYEGVATDILELSEKKPLHCEDIKQYPKLVGGIRITTWKAGDSGNPGAGTLGFLATLDEVEGPDNVVLVSNKHVLAGNGEAVGQRVSNPIGFEALDPANPREPQTGLVDSPESRALIAKIDNIGLETGHPYKYPEDGGDPALYFVDAATAKLDIRISSTCNKSTGVEYANRIRDLKLNPTEDNEDGNSKIVAVARLEPDDVAPGEGDTGPDADTDPTNDYVVFKVGARTGKTRGKIVDAMAPASNDAADGSDFKIEVLGTDCDSFPRFAAEGDSGAAIINANNELIGILYSVSANDERFAFGCHIHPLMDFFQITPISEANPPVGPAGEARSGEMGALLPREEKVLELRQKIEASAKTGPLFRAFMEHWDEIVWLVNNRRPLLVAWHRAKGPAYVAHLSESARRPGHRVPREIDGQSRRALLTRMASLLREVGSPELHVFIDAYLAHTLAVAEEIDDLHTFADALTEAPADA